MVVFPFWGGTSNRHDPDSLQRDSVQVDMDQEKGDRQSDWVHIDTDSGPEWTTTIWKDNEEPVQTCCLGYETILKTLNRGQNIEKLRKNNENIVFLSFA